VLLLRHRTSDSGPDLSFDTSASPEYVSGLGRANLAETFFCLVPLMLCVAFVAPLFDAWLFLLYYCSWRRGLLLATSFLVPWLARVAPFSLVMRLPFYCAPPPAADVAIPDPTPVDLAAGTPSAKSSGSTSRPNLFVGNDDDEESDDDEDACVEIPLITLIHSRGKAIMNDAAAAPSEGASRSQAFTAPIHSFRDLTGDAIHMDFFPFTPGPYYATYPEDGVVGGSYEVSRKEWDGPHHPTLTILTKEIFKDLSICKTMVDQFLTPREMESFWDNIEVTDLNDKVSSSDAAFVKDKAKGKDRKKKIKSLSKSLDQLTAEVSHLSFDLNQSRNSFVRKFLASDEFSRVQGELLSLTANAGFEHGLHMDRTQEQFDAALKKISRFVPGAQSRLIEATLLVATTDNLFLNKVVAHSAQPLSDIVDLKPDRLAHPAVVPTPRAVGVSPPVPMELTVTPAPSSVELFSSDAPPLSVAALEQNKEWLNATVDTTDEILLMLLLRNLGRFLCKLRPLLRRARDMLENTACCSELEGTPTVDVWLSIQRTLSHVTRPKPNGSPLRP
ncbi:hypothetical protein Tco_0869149, partial [Tanacetum coccineum]